MNNKSLITKILCFRKWSKKSQKKFFDMLKKGNIIVDKKLLVDLCSGIYSD
ncbi:hypothetical protein SAMN05444280_11620 [Tangfeifania diversioriginum]|uniref:Uncharacterized protein n=1 Tax=Tangfeifania diversioriginum TaxID=1168035 RepID=A0A1M6IAQ4_9BACT|nr:hypothetical protein SAMN05444280_11620 [Tangfeifania diversioriginum]